MNGSCSPCFSGPFVEALLEMKSSNLSTKFKDFLRTLRENLTGKYAGPFAGIVKVAYLKVCEFLKTLTNSLMY